MRKTAALLAIASLVLIEAGCGDSSGAAARPSGPSVARVATVVAERGTVRRTTDQPGQIEAFETTLIHAKLSGYVSTVRVNIGDAVKKGQVLAELRVPEIEADAAEKRAMTIEAEAERTQSEAALEVARAKIESAKSKVEEVQATVRRADADAARWQSEFARVQQLFNERTLTGSLLDETRSKWTSAEAARDEVRAQVHSATVALGEARAMEDKARADIVAAVAHVQVTRAVAQRSDAMLSYSKIEAPFDGVVTRRNVDPGWLTTAGATGEPLFVVARSDPLTITLGVPELDAPFVNVGDPARVRVQALDGRTFEGKVTRTAWAIDTPTRTLRAEIDLANDAGTLRAGLYAYVSIIAEEHPNALVVPTSALFKEGAQSFLVVVTSGKAARREVKVGIVDGDRAEVLSGLKGDETIVGANAAALTDGQTVESIRAESAQAKPK